jgi:hypothetical protein
VVGPLLPAASNIVLTLEAIGGDKRKAAPIVFKNEV